MPRAPKAPKLAQAVDEFLEWLELDKHRSAGTVAEYRADLGRFCAYADGHGFNDGPVSALDREMIRSYQRSVARTRTKVGPQPRPLAPATRKRRLVSLRSFLRFAAREEWLVGDLGGTIDLPKLAERLPKPLEDAARTKLHRAIGGTTVEAKRDRALILLLLSSGARISEVLRLDRADWAMDRVTVRGKGDRERVLMITDKARQAVDDYLAARDDPSPALFISFQPAVRGKRENRLSDDGARHICNRLARVLGIPPFHPHQLRHSLGTLLQETVGDARLTAETLGHVGLASVAGYTKITEGRRRMAQEEMQRRGL